MLLQIAEENLEVDSKFRALVAIGSLVWLNTFSINPLAPHSLVNMKDPFEVYICSFKSWFFNFIFI